MSWLAALQADAVGWLIVPEYGFRFESYLSSRLIVTHSRRGLLSLSSGLSMLRIDFVAAEPGDCPRASRFLQHVLKISPLPLRERPGVRASRIASFISVIYGQSALTLALSQRERGLIFPKTRS